ncbi:MAG: hypothetical protein U1F71_19880 [Verrucomicrobiaceae bacterium]
MSFSRRQLWIVVLILGLGVFPVAAQTSDPANDPATLPFDPALGSSITLNGEWNYSSATLLLNQTSTGTITYSTPLSLSSGTVSIDPGLISTSSTAGTLVLSASNNTTTSTSGSTINLAELVNTNLLPGSLIYLSPVVPSSSTSTAGSTSSGGLIAISPTVSGSSLSLSSSQQLTMVATISFSSGTLLTGTTLNRSTGTTLNRSTGTTLNISSGTLSLAQTNTSSPVTISSGTVSFQSAMTFGSNLDLQSNGTMKFYLNEAGAGTTNGQLTVSGDVTLSGDLAIVASTNLPAGSTFVVLNKTSTGAITGTFTGRHQGSVVSVSGNDFIVSYTGGDGNDVTLTALSKPEVWRHIHFGTIDNTGTAADTADADGDGIPNLIERACNLDPSASSTLPVSTTRTGTNLEYSYTRSVASVNAGDVFTVEWNDSLVPADWSSDGVTQEVQSDDGTVQVVKALVPAADTGHRFIRLKVTPAP